MTHDRDVVLIDERQSTGHYSTIGLRLRLTVCEVLLAQSKRVARAYWGMKPKFVDPSRRNHCKFRFGKLIQQPRSDRHEEGPWCCDTASPERGIGGGIVVMDR
jgi:hypothetical protein